VSVLKLYLEALAGSVMDWGGIDYGWPLIQTSEDTLMSLRELPDELGFLRKIRNNGLQSGACDERRRGYRSFNARW
jgi:hypothetical protein